MNMHEFPNDETGDNGYDEPSLKTMRAAGSEGSLGLVGQYELLRKLGGGGFGVVYLARDIASGVEVALKTLHPLLKNSAEEMDQLREKFALVARLAHPNIATALVLYQTRDINIYDDTARRELRLSPGDGVMVMRYAPGVTLSKWRRQFPDGIVPLERALDIGRQLASALDYAHGERIVHRDVKPSNVMVETKADGRLCVRILDFGLAAEIRSSMSRVSTETGDTSGTRPYMAPEQWLGRKQDGRTDQYALACVLYELLSGAPPFAGVFETGDPMIMMATVKGEAPEEIENLPATANAALLRALAKTSKDRFPTCGEFIEALSPETRPPDILAQIPAISQGGAGSPSKPAAASDPAALEASVLRRKVALSRRVSAMTPADRNDSELGAFATDADIELAAADEAFKYGRFAAAAECLDRAEGALKALDRTKEQRDEDKARAALAEAEHRAIQESARKAREEAERSAPKEAGQRKVVRVSGTEFPLRWCPAGSFWMGSPKSESARFSDEKQHQVTLTRGFWIGETPVTQAQWLAVDGTVPSYHRDGKSWLGFGGDPSLQHPVEQVSWEDCRLFLNTLNEVAPVDGYQWRFPTEVQWEYACRAGSTGAYAGILDDMGWYSENSEGHTHPVAQKKPNNWGLYDMHGNVYEWCSDWFGPLLDRAATDPTGPERGAYRVTRGGSWNRDARICRSAYRSNCDPVCRYADVGLRVVLVPVP